MKKMKTVVRRYFSKKKGVWVEKTYTYTKDYEQRKVIVTKTGKITKKGQQRIDEMLDNMTFTQRNEAESYIKQAVKQKKRLTDTGLTSKIAKNRREKMLINMGSSLQEALQNLDGATELDYFNEANWNGDIFTNPETGKQFRFQFDYNGDGWVAV